MNDFIQLGGFDDEDHHRAEALVLPHIEELLAISRIRDALDVAATTRRGVAVVGPKGSGKTTSLRRAMREFTLLERRKVEKDAKYQRRHLLRVRGFRAKTYREVVFAIFGALIGDAYSIQTRGRRKTDDELLQELVVLLLQRPVAVLVVDEFEYTTPVLLEVLRDLMSEAQDRDRWRAGVDDTGYVALGIGVLIVGTDDVARRLAATAEAQERWGAVVHLGRVTAADVPRIYLAWFPAFGAHVERIGARRWDAFIGKHVSLGQSVSLHLLESHARFYFRRMVRKKLDGGAREQTPFHEQIFLLTLREARWLPGKGRPGSKDSKGGETDGA